MGIAKRGAQEHLGFAIAKLFREVQSALDMIQRSDGGVRPHQQAGQHVQRPQYARFVLFGFMNLQHLVEGGHRFVFALLFDLDLANRFQDLQDAGECPRADAQG